MFGPMNTPVGSWKDKRIWLIGASSGIGAALAKQALAMGAKVALSARRLDALEEVAGEASNALIVPFDVLDHAAWRTRHAEICAAFGGVDLLLFCAADYRPERSWEVSDDVAEQTLKTNLVSVYSALSSVLPTMLAEGSGGIALVASVAGYMGLPNASVYGPGKAALINLAEILYSDLHAKGLSVYLINPGFVKTGLTAKNDFAMPGLQTPDAAAEKIWKGIAEGKFEIHFPYRFTRILKLIQMLPYRWRFALFQRFLHPT
ncbi:SDR family NAD(P)-dependent oxidoreductase [Herbaspirillum rhizosphaerae]|uniref:SDR family NAD(P)-dependent oxidoreductase n=1 Tax=Herbaspirillum rhizosphaerae TaxID=346179 RepID=A0ABW8ZCQ6_9BURK